MTPPVDRFTGCLLACACGDALGQPIEAFPPDRLQREFGEIRDFMPGDARFARPLGAGQWTDDTQLTLDVARCLVECGGLDPANLAHRFSRGHPEGIRYSGYTVMQAIRRLHQGISWDRSGLAGDHAQGNGALMRIAPIGLWDCLHPERLAEDVRLCSLITHAHPEPITGALAGAYVVARAATGTLDPETIVADAAAQIDGTRVAENLRRVDEVLASGVSTQEGLATLGTTGWVVHTTAAALYCFLRTPGDLERTVIDAVMGGHDADTTAAVAGAISGAYNGEGAIPPRWREAVELGAEIRELGEALWRAVMGA